MTWSPRRWLVATGAAAGALVLAGALLAAAGPHRAREAFPDGTPEAVVQRYVDAVLAGDRRTARATFTAALAARCTIGAFDRAFGETEAWIGGAERPVDHRIQVVERSDMDGGRVRLRVRDAHAQVEPPFGGSRWTSDHEFVLVQVDGVWRLDAADWPEPCP